MSRRLKSIRQQSTPISLFSFLDILGGTIGILILIISVFFIQLQTGKQIVQMVAETSQIEKKIPRYIVCNGSYAPIRPERDVVACRRYNSSFFSDHILTTI